jgi:hypothetical protein
MTEKGWRDCRLEIASSRGTLLANKEFLFSSLKKAGGGIKV